MSSPFCRRCRRPGSSLKRGGLCWRCYVDPVLRAHYLNAADPEGDVPLAAAATEALAGTPAKMQIMSERETRSESLHHPDDRGVPVLPSWTATLPDGREVGPMEAWTKSEARSLLKDRLTFVTAGGVIPLGTLLARSDGQEVATSSGRHHRRSPPTTYATAAETANAS